MSCVSTTFSTVQAQLLALTAVIKDCIILLEFGLHSSVPTDHKNLTFCPAYPINAIFAPPPPKKNGPCKITLMRAKINLMHLLIQSLQAIIDLMQVCLHQFSYCFNQFNGRVHQYVIIEHNLYFFSKQFLNCFPIPKETLSPFFRPTLNPTVIVWTT